MGDVGLLAAGSTGAVKGAAKAADKAIDAAGKGNVAKTAQNTIPKYVQGSLSQADELAFRATLAHIDNGTVPTGALSKKWGTKFKNYEGKLPGGSGANSPYREYRVARQVVKLVQEQIV